MTDGEKLKRIGAWYGVRAVAIGSAIIMAKLAWMLGLAVLRHV